MSDISARPKLPWIVDKWCQFLNFCSSSLPPGPKFVPMNYVINFQKGGTLILCLFLLNKYHAFDSPQCMAYTALHGSYGLCWLLKELVFPDPKWSVKITASSAMASILVVLGPYWLAAFLLMSGQGTLRTPIEILATSLIYVLGLVIMMGSDCQKYFLLKERKGLITNGFFARVRHPNYLGEMMIYGSFAYLSGHPIPWVVVSYVWALIFLPNMLQKEASMSRYPQWKAYLSRSGFLFPQWN